MSDIETLLKDQTWKGKPSHKRSISDGNALKSSSLHISELNSFKNNHDSLRMLPKVVNSKRPFLARLAVPYNILDSKLRSLSTRYRVPNCIQVPLIKKLPFGKHTVNDMEIKFAVVLQKSQSIHVTDKVIRNLKKQSGRIK